MSDSHTLTHTQLLVVVVVVVSNKYSLLQDENKSRCCTLRHSRKMSGVYETQRESKINMECIL